jgi:hypothetical protein
MRTTGTYRGEEMLTVVSPQKLYLSAGTVMRSPATWQEYQMCRIICPIEYPKFGCFGIKN